MKFNSRPLRKYCSKFFVRFFKDTRNVPQFYIIFLDRLIFLFAFKPFNAQKPRLLLEL